MEDGIEAPEAPRPSPGRGETLEHALSAALADSIGGPLDYVLNPQAETLLVVDGTAPEESLVAVRETMAALNAIGVARGRLSAVVANDALVAPADASTTRDRISDLGIVCGLRDPGRSARFPAMRFADG